MTASVLVATPTWMRGEGTAMRAETIASINAQDCRDDFTWIVTVDNPWPVPDPRNVLPQYRRIRETFLQGDWNSLVLVEHDNVLPDTNALRRLLETPADVVYAPYVFRHGGGLSTWKYISDISLGMPLSQHPAELAKARAAGVWRVSGAGFGCTLIRRRVVEAIPFRPDTGGGAPDIPFAQDCLRERIVAMANMTVAVGHYTAEGKLLLPFGEGGSMAIYEAVQTVNVMVSGRFIALETGVTYEFTPDEAGDIMKVGYIKAFNADQSSSADDEAEVQPRRRKPTSEKRVLPPIEKADLP